MGTPFEDATVLVVGGAGFVGSNLCRRLLDARAREVSVVDNLLSSERENLPEDARIRFTEGSIADDRVLSSLDDRFDYIFHLATYHGNQSSIHDPLADHENNTLTTLKLLNRIRDWKNLRKLVYSGAGCAVAEKTASDAHATCEDAPISIHMDSPYSISKIVGEFYCVYYRKQHGVPAVRARFQNVYGPGEVLGAGRWRGTPATVWRNVVPTFVWKSLAREALPLENEGRGSRDFIFVDDICRGLMACAHLGVPGDVYNLASGVETTVRELAEAINRLTANPTPCTLLPKRPWDTSIKRFGSTEKARAELGFTAAVGLDEGLRRTVEWTRRERGRVERTMAKHGEAMVACGAWAG